jgi:outer membrane protein
MKMKKLIVLLFMILPLGVIAQEVKIAFVNTNEVFSLMPENANIEKELVALNEKYAAELKSMQEEYQRKAAAYIEQQDSLTENIRLKRMQDIEDIRTRIDNFYPIAQQDIEKKQQELIQPVREKIQKAIREVGEEKGYTYIIDPQILLYTGNNAIDATSFVKVKLGL